MTDPLEQYHAVVVELVRSWGADKVNDAAQRTFRHSAAYITQPFQASVILKDMQERYPDFQPTVAPQEEQVTNQEETMANEVITVPPATNGEPRAVAEMKSQVRAIAAWMQPQNLTEAMAIAGMLHQSNTFSTKFKNSGQIMMAMLAGAEMGIGIYQALDGVHIYDGKMVIGAGMKYLAINRGGRYAVKVLTKADLTRDYCHLVFYRVLPGGTHELIGEVIEKIGEVSEKLLRKDNWKNHPDDMLFATAMNKGCRRFCPDYAFGNEDEDEEQTSQVSRIQDAAVAESQQPQVVQQQPFAAPETPPPQKPTREIMSDQLGDRIDELCKQGGFSPDRLVGYCERLRTGYGDVPGDPEVTDCTKITTDQATTLIRLLEGMIAKQAQPATG